MTSPSPVCRALPKSLYTKPPAGSDAVVPALFRLACLLLIAIGWISQAAAQVVVNEIMYRPGAGYPEPTALEFIELHNPTAAAVDLSGWALTSGVSFVFPAGANIPAGGFRVVGANPATLQSTYGISGVFGPWTAGAALANGGEKIAISKPGTTAGTFEEVDSVTYASEGDWAVRVRETTFNGWDWSTPANGGNRSIELRNPLISNDNGQNWAPSDGPLGATPGAQNTALSGNVAPIIHDVSHSPAVPKSTDPVTISCRVTDEAAPAFLTATLFWRDATTATPGAFQQQAMTNDGTNRFSTVLAAKVNLAIVEFYVSVTDGVSTRTWPAPTSEGQNANCQYQVTNEVLDPTAAYYFLVLSGAENAAYDAAAPGDNRTKNDRQFNTTLIVKNGSESTIRYRSAIRFRGNSSRSYQFKPLRVNLPGDDTWDGESTFNLNPRASYLQFVGMRLLQLSGVRAPDSIPVKPRRNGVEYSTSSGSTPDYGYWVREEDIGGDFVSNHFPEAKGGNIYKKIDDGGGLNFYWRSGRPAPANPDTLLDGWGKQNNSSANDWGDLTSFFQVWQTAAAPHFPGSPVNDVAGSNSSRISGTGNWNNTAFTAAELASVESVSDLDQWARWFAVMTILQDYETNISNGVDDDYSAYFAPTPGGKPKMNLITHDMDTILGLGDTTTLPTATGLYDMTEAGGGGFGGGGGLAFRTLLPLFGTAAVPGNAAFRQKYFDAIRELFGTVFDANTTGNPSPAFYQFIDSHLTGWAPAATITAIKTWMTQRQAHLLPLVGGSAITPPAATSTSSVVSVPGSLMIHEVLSQNISAHLNGTTYPDVIELYNSSGAPIDLAGKSITDDVSAKAKYVFPAGTTIGAGGYLIIYADTAPAGTPGLHAGFALDSDGDGVYLFDSPANGQALLDSITFGLQIPDYSIGRTGTGREVWTLCTPTVGTANVAVPGFGAPGALKINEWAGNRDYLLADDFLELYNPATQPVALGGMILTDDFVNYPAKSVLPDLSFIGPGAFLDLAAKGNSASAGNASELPFRVGANFGLLAVLGQNGTIVDRVDVVAQPADTSRGRSPDGGPAVATFGLPATIPTPGAPNLTPPASVLALISNLRISELLFAPTNLEYVELHNIGTSPLDLSGVRFTQGITYTFAQGVTLAAGAYTIVCRDRAAFQAQFGATAPIAAGFFTGSLDNAGETIAIQPPVPWNVNILNFRYDSGWYDPETTNGFALTLVDDVNTAARDWNERHSWSPSPALYGTPGADSPPTVTSPLAITGYTDRALSYQIAATKSPTAFNAVTLPSGLTVNPSTGLITGTPTATGVFNVTLSATNGVGTGTRTLALTISAPPPPAILSSGIASGTVNAPLTYQIVATNTATGFGATGLPPGLSVNTTTGLISGTPTQTGSFDVTLTATNAFGTAQKSLVLSVRLPAPPVVNSVSTATAVLSDPFTYQITAVSSPSSYGATGLPAGLAVNSSNGLISGAATVTGAFSVILSATNAGGTGIKPLLLTVNSSGPLTKLAWSPIDFPQKVGVPFTATVQGQDAQGRTVREFNGGFTIKGEGQGTTAAIALITECGTNTIDYFEIQNVGNIPANTTGWFIVPNNATAGVSAVNAAWPLPASIAPGQVIAISENTPGVYPTQIDWSSGFGGTTSGWCMLCDATGAVRDFVGWGYTAAQITSINVPTVTVAGSTYTNITVPAAQWTGNGAGAGFNTGTKTRTGTSDANTAANWSTGNSETNKGIQNTGLTVPFLPPPPSVQITPGAGNLFAGVWTGNIAVAELVTGMRLVATDGGGHVANSNTFDTVPPPPPVITSPIAARAVVGGPFSYQILGTNFPNGFSATGLSSGLNVSTSGVIAGTPTAPGVIDVTIAATNLGGTGSGAVSITVEPDADGDGMGDTWEAANGLSNSANDASSDLDLDGQSNLAEWQAGTTPNNALSRFTVNNSQLVNGNFVITWASAIGKRYRVFSRSALSSGTWIDLTPTPVAASGAETSFIHLGGGLEAQRFYRVSIEP